MKATIASLMLVIALCGVGFAEDGAPPAEGPGRHMPCPCAEGARGHGFRMGPGEHGRGMGPMGPGMWWKNSELLRKVGVSDEQVQKIEKIFRDHRMQLIDLHAALEKQEVLLEPLVGAEQPDESQVIAQIDRVAQARADLEKSNAQMLLAVRRVLTIEQWKKLHDLRNEAPFHHGGPQMEPPAGQPRGE